jgi:hypothetical protein
MEWTLNPGDYIVRKELHDQYGGGREGGISPSSKTPNIFLFTDPPVGRLHGYFDGWGVDGKFHYSGEGQKGDQRMVRGNSAVRDHQLKGRSLRLLRGSGGSVEYLGEFALEPSQPWYESEAPESGHSDVIRKVIVFRLAPIGEVIHDPSDVLPPPVEESVTLVRVEDLNTETFAINPSAQPKEGERREQRLVLEYKTFMEQKGSVIRRMRCRPAGEAKPIFSDVYDEVRRNLIEAKGTVTREAIRMAIGQLADYSRFLESVAKAALLPERPRKDLETLLESQGISTIWQTDIGFEDNAGGIFT